MAGWSGLSSSPNLGAVLASQARPHSSLIPCPSHVSQGISSPRCGWPSLECVEALSLWQPSRGRGRLGSGTGKVGVASLSWAGMGHMAEEAGLQGMDQMWGWVSRARSWVNDTRSRVFLTSQ